MALLARWRFAGQPDFRVQTRIQLGNTEIRVGIVNEVRKAVVEVLYKNPELRASCWRR
jgi:DNA gyrase/topoisomerase IV subunit B